MIYHADVSIQYDRDRIFRRLRIEAGTNVHHYAAASFPALAEIAETRLQMVHAYTVQKNFQPVGIPEVDSCAYLVTCLSSCSEEIMSAIGGLLEQGDFLEGYILNDLVNEILFNASDQMNRQIAAAMKTLGCHLTRRFSPGEEELGLEYQAPLLESFQGEQALAHVRLTESYMLYPEKSMLYLFGADGSNPEISVEHDCSKCPNITCFFRCEGGPAACS